MGHNYNKISPRVFLHALNRGKIIIHTLERIRSYFFISFVKNVLQ